MLPDAIGGSRVLPGGNRVRAAAWRPGQGLDRGVRLLARGGREVVAAGDAAQLGPQPPQRRGPFRIPGIEGRRSRNPLLDLVYRTWPNVFASVIVALLKRA